MKNDILKLLQREIIPTIGSVELANVALCTAYATSTVGGWAQEIELEVSPEIMERGKRDRIPELNRVGLEYAAALGTVLLNPDRRCLLMAEITDEANFCLIQVCKQGFQRIPGQGCLNHLIHRQSILYQLFVEIGNGFLMVTTEMPTLSSPADRSIDDILPGTVIVVGIIITDLAAVVTQINQIKIGGGDMESGITQIPGDGQGFQKNFRTNDTGTEIHVNAFIHVGHGVAHLVEIDTAGFADG